MPNRPLKIKGVTDFVKHFPKLEKDKFISFGKSETKEDGSVELNFEISETFIRAYKKLKNLGEDIEVTEEEIQAFVKQLILESFKKNEQ